jgi:hypothetical protein
MANEKSQHSYRSEEFFTTRFHYWDKLQEQHKNLVREIYQLIGKTIRKYNKEFAGPSYTGKFTKKRYISPQKLRFLLLEYLDKDIWPECFYITSSSSPYYCKVDELQKIKLHVTEALQHGIWIYWDSQYVSLTESDFTTHMKTYLVDVVTYKCVYSEKKECMFSSVISAFLEKEYGYDEYYCSGGYGDYCDD